MATDPTPNPADVFEKLRLPDNPISPRTAFATSLRARIERTLGVPPSNPTGEPMSNIPKTAPGLHTVTPYLCIRGAAAAIEFYTSVFGAIEEGERYVDQSDGKIGHAQIRIGDSTLMISDEYPSYGVGGPETYGGTTVALQLYVDDLEETYAQALAAGAQGLRPPADQFYGRSATIVDPWGHRWSLQVVVDDREMPPLKGFDIEQKVEIPQRTASGEALLEGPAQLGYFALQAADLERAKTFFGSLFGWTFEQTGHITNIDPPGGLSPAGVSGPPILYFQVRDLDVAAARVIELGGTVISRSTYPSGGTAECTDDQGTRFELHLPAVGYERQ